MKYLPWAITICSMFVSIWAVTKTQIPLSHQTVQQSSLTYPFLSKTVQTTDSKDSIINFVPLRRDLQAYVATRSGNIGIYFDYIPTGSWIGINERNPFMYASLLKIPLVMAIYNRIHLGQLTLTDPLTITEEMMDPDYGTLWEKGAGATITVKAAIEEALIHSDNTAYNLLKKSIPLEEFANVFGFLDIPIEVQGNEPAVTPKNYVSILRSLYYSSFLPPEYSNEILSILSRSTFTKGIRGPVPTSIPIAEKIGIRFSENLLGDCGIVYHPIRPYFLCIMEKTDSIPNAEETIQEISRKIYTYITTR